MVRKQVVAKVPCPVAVITSVHVGEESVVKVGTYSVVVPSVKASGRLLADLFLLAYNWIVCVRCQRWTTVLTVACDWYPSTCDRYC